MAKDIKVVKGNDEIIINELQLEDFEKRGYKQINKKNSKPKKEKENKWQHTTEKKE
tara:strand:+ start:564 stop:731 length:168 start_codon:yes stop_codon:yes gene_type:complete